MLKYIIGSLLNLFNRGISIFVLIDNKSEISKKAKINRGVKIFDSSIKSYSYVGSQSEIVCSDIGKFCSIANKCSIGLATHSIKHLSTSPIFTARKNGTGHSWTTNTSFQESLRVTIGNDVWIGTKAIIMGGIKIGNGAVIGAGAIVTNDIPDYAIAVGVPAKVIKYRFEKPIIEKLSKINWWNISDKNLKKHINLFKSEKITLEDLDKMQK